ncbi:MAG: UDP-N-acetylmuramoyl-L-alanyl-D-glutamate--2,6-diaminopimelate ligase [Lentisphaerae bacterium]|nr:UDP-N-acetylmuramoyl-L-alanyl-D-glutamate--2,6-diaminopimelate ligase [Lentisphaerota bacterium]
MRIESILQVIQPMTVKGPRQADIRGIACDSRQVRPGHLFVALRGTREDGAKYVEDAIRRGAVAIVSEHNDWARRDITHIRVEDARRAVAEIACAFHDHPSAQLETIGVTGTNGKTTTTFMIRDILRAAGRNPGLIGTVMYEMGARCIPANRTTPEATDLQSMLAQMVVAGCASAVMEVSSHALEQKRVWGIDFDVGVFTNLTRDHLDYHGTMERYFGAKALLFRGLGQMEKSAAAVINLDDSWGQQLANTGGGWSSLVTYGLHPGALVRAVNVDLGPQGSTFTIDSPWGSVDVRLGLMGRYNVSNALAAFAACATRGLRPDFIAGVLGAFRSAPGRLEPIPNGRGLQVYVDYAHTDDALSNVLTTLREIAPRKLIVVFGCGGDRDRSKRPRMGGVAGLYADFTVLTSDNPRSEDPGAILAEIAEGMPEGARHETLPDREAAIARAIEVARPGDVVLIAGKGHENYQEFARTVIPFDDREVARRLLA